MGENTEGEGPRNHGACLERLKAEPHFKGLLREAQWESCVPTMLPASSHCRLS